jgi:glyoxylate carboligase
MSNEFSTFFFINKLKIDFTYIKAFQYYTVENNNFIEVFISGNKSFTEFFLVQLAYDFINLKNQQKT